MKATNKTVRWSVAGALLLQAASAQAMDLMDAYTQARTHDPAMLAAHEARQSGQEKRVQGDALLRPHVYLQAGVIYVDRHTSGETPAALAALMPSDGSSTVRHSAVQFSQPLYDAVASAGRKQLHQQTTLSEAEFDRARQALAQRVAEAYFGVLLADETLSVLRAERAAVAMQRDRAQARFEVGRSTVTDIEEARARHDQVSAREIAARSTLELRRAQFRETIGSPADELAGLKPHIAPSALEPDGLQVWQARGEDHGTTVRVKRTLLEIASAEIDKHRLTGRPTLSLVGSYTVQRQNDGLSSRMAPGHERGGVMGLQLTVPLYAGGAIDSREREARAKKRQAEQELAAAMRDTRLQVQEGYLTVQTSLAQVSAFEQSVISARSALDATLLGHDVGTRTALDVLDMQQRFFGAQLDLLHARFDYLLGRVRLAAAAGELDEAELNRLNVWLAAR